MTVEGWITLVILAVASVLFYKRWLPLEVTALSLPLVLFATGVLTKPADIFKGFGSTAVITLAALFVIGAGLQESGVTTLVARALQGLGGSDELRLSLVVMIFAVAVSAFMPNAAAVALLLPAVALLSRRTQVAPSRLFIPLSFAAVLGGNITLIGATPNLLVAEIASEGPQIKLGMFEFARVGLPMALAGVLFMAFVGRRMLPVRRPEDRLREALHPEAAARNYGLARTLFRMKLLPKSRISGKSIADSGLRSKYGLEAVVVVRDGRLRRQFIEPRPDLILLPGDELFVEGDDEAAWTLAEECTVQFGLADPADIEAILGRGLTLAEVTIPPRSEAIGHTFKDLGFRTRYGLNVLSLWRRGEALRAGSADIKLEPGDAFLVSGKTQRLGALAKDPDWVVLTDHGVPEDVSRAPLALVWLLVAILPPTLLGVEASYSALAAALLMVASGCVGLPAAHRALDWKVLFLVIGIVPVGVAMQQHGVASMASSGLLAATGSLGSVGVLAGIFLLAAGIAMFSTNSTAAVLMAPVALEAATSGLVDPRKALLAVAFGAGCAFVLPVHQCNLQVMGPGGYVPRDFIRTGAALTVVVSIVAIIALAWA